MEQDSSSETSSRRKFKEAPGPWPWRGNLMLLAFFVLASVIQLVGAGSVQVDANPNIVQTTDAQLVVGINLDDAVEAGGWIRLSFPDLMQISSSATNCREEAGLPEPKFSCVADVAGNQLIINLQSTFESGRSYQVLVDSAVTLPETNITVDPIRMSTSANEHRDGSFRAQPGTLTSAQLKPVSEVVAAGTNLLVSIKTANVIPRNGKIHILVGEYWNEGAVDDKIDYFGSISCDSFVIGGQENEAEDYYCQWLDRKRVEIEGGLLAQQSTPAGTVISWNIVGFRNPISPHDRYEIFTVYTSAAQVDLVVDERLVYVEVDVPATLVQASFAVSPLQTTNQGIVQEENIMDLKFASPTPFRAQCTVEYWFPTEYYDAELVTKVTTGDLFGGRKVAYAKGAGDTPSGTQFVVTEEEGGAYKAVKFASCETFRSQDFAETTRIYGFKQPASTERTSAIKIYVKDADRHVVAQLEEGVTFQAKRGTITFNTASMEPTTVLITTAITFSFYPVHGLMASMSPQIVLEFPGDYVVQRACDIVPIKGLGAAPDCAADVVHNTLTISTEMTEDLVGGGELAFAARYIRVPGSLGGGKDNIVIKTLLQGRDRAFHEVDSVGFKARDFLKITPGAMTAEVKSASDQAYAKTFYTITIKPEHQIPQYSIITVIYPPELVIEDMSLSQTHCTDWKNFPSNQGHCNIFPNRTIIVNKGFQQGAGGKAKDTEYSWSVPYVTSPRSLLETSTFVIHTRDQYFNKIDEVTSGVTVQMSRPALFKRAELVLGSYQNTARTTYSFRIAATNPLSAGNIILLTFPKATLLPASEEDYACRSNSEDYFTALACSTMPGKEGTVKMVPSLLRPIPALETFEFEVHGIMNPNSTAPAGAVGIAIYSDDGYEDILNQDAGNLHVQTYIPYTVDESKYSLHRTITGPGLDTTCYITFTLEHSLDKDSGIIVSYPAEAIADPDARPLEVTVDARDYNFPTVLSKPSFIDYSARQIMFADAEGFTEPLVVEQGKEQKMTITIKGLRNPLNNDNSQSFTIVAFNRFENHLHLVDQVETGLEIHNPCDYPCKTCSAQQPSRCRSCFQDTSLTKYTFLEEDTCLEECSLGYYYDSSAVRCKKCDPKCLTCKDRADKCTTCGGSRYNMLRGTECVNACGVGYIDDPPRHMCQPCKDGCTACSQHTANCTACDKQGPIPYFFDWNCLDGCPSYISVSKGDQCLPCDSNCKECAGEPDRCTACHDYMRLDSFANRCAPACKPHEQIYNYDTGGCDQCHETCTTCVNTVTECTFCKPGLVLNMDSTCRESCGSTGQIPLDGICRECQEPCASCKDTADTCTTCIGELLLYNGTCVDHCPLKFEPNNQTINQCILVGLICPDGFYVNAAGEGCVPIKFHCEAGFEINEAGTACIPIPGTPVPFPFLFMTICIALVVTGSYLKDKHSTKFGTCLIFLIGNMELLEYGLIAIFAAQLALVFPSLLAFISLVMLIVSNVAFSVAFRRQAYNDSIFNEWSKHHPKTAILVPLLCTFWNFKNVRFFFSGFFGMPNTKASFRNPRQAIHRNLKLMTVFHYIFVYGPIYLADFLIIISTKWGHQVLVLAIETALLQTLVIYLTLKEFQDPHSLYSDQSKYSKLRPKKQGQVAVAGLFEEHELDEEQLIKEEKGLRNYHASLREKCLTKLMLQVGENFLFAKQAVDIGGSITKVFHKYEKERLQIRRANSMEDFKASKKRWISQSSGGTDGTRIDDGYSDESDEYESSPRVLERNDPQFSTIQHRRMSFPFDRPDMAQKVEDQAFFLEMTKMRRAIVEEYQKDNCYREVKPPQKASKTFVRKKKMVNRRTQTYLRELLWVEGEDVLDSDQEVILEEDCELDENFTKGLIDGVIDAYSAEESPDELSKRGPRRRRRKEKKHEAPEFELKDILGDFDIDDQGNHVILRDDASGDLVDKNDQRVSNRGYLVDKFGNVINKLGTIIFKVTELDSEGEIPADFVFEKHKEKLLEMDQAIDPEYKVAELDMTPPAQPLPQKSPTKETEEDEDELVERELQQFKQGAQMSSRSGSKDHHLEDLPLEDDNRFIADDNQNIDDMIDLITKKTVPDQQLAFVKKGKKKQRSRSGKHRPGMPNGKQNQKINRIADVIGGMASQVADSVNRQQSDAAVMDISPTLVGRRQQSQNALRRADFSVVSQEFGFKQEKPQRIQRSRDGSQDDGLLGKTYGYDQSLRLEAQRPKKIRPESGQVRITSNDPRLQTLGQIYNRAQNPRYQSGSQRNLAQRAAASRLESEKEAIVSQTIDRLNAQYMQQTGQVPNFGQHADEQAETMDRSGQKRKPKHTEEAPGLTPLRKQNWLGK